jgi:hypothetical protein
MGLDMRIVPDDSLDAIESALTSAGFDVTVRKREIKIPDDLPGHIAVTMPDHPIIIHDITVSDGTNSIVLSYGVDEGEFGGYCIYIPNLGAWRPRLNRELHDFQSQVTNVLESVGAYWPFPEDGG